MNPRIMDDSDEVNQPTNKEAVVLEAEPVPDSALDEQHSFRRIVNAFRQYRFVSKLKVERTVKYIRELPHHHITLLREYREHLKRTVEAIDRNDQVLQEIVKCAGTIFESDHPIFSLNADLSYLEPPTADEIDRVQTTLKQFVRDWSTEGQAEREACYKPIIDTVISEFANTLKPREDVKILVPGAGLGRLVFEIAEQGFSCQGNEFSMYMLIASHFILNKCGGLNQYTICPWVSQSINVLRAEDQLKEVCFPDVNPVERKQDSELSMAAGDFLEIYTEADAWDCVATCFFIDCAHNIVAFVETIYKILSPGGVWVNLGPLLYHFADMSSEKSIEPSYDILKAIILKIGFLMEVEDTQVRSTYTQNPASMMQYGYKSVFFVCRKPLNPPHQASES